MNAGCEYDHYVLDQGSTDGTPEWLLSDPLLDVVTVDENIGCCRGWNTLVELAFSQGDYDLAVCVDNDAELTQPDTLRAVCSAVMDSGQILSPRVEGLRNPPPTVGTFAAGSLMVDETQILGNIFMAIPANLLRLFRWDETYPLWAGGESITGWHRARGGKCGYVQGYTVNHYRTTDGQHQDYPEYFERRVLEGGPV